METKEICGCGKHRGADGNWKGGNERLKRLVTKWRDSGDVSEDGFKFEKGICNECKGIAEKKLLVAANK